METALIIYLYFTLQTLFAVCCIGSIAALFLTFLSIIDETRETASERWKKYGKPWAIAVAVFSILLVLVPSKDTIKYMIGGTAIVEASKLEGVEKLPQNIIDLANAFLEETTEEVSD